MVRFHDSVAMDLSLVNLVVSAILTGLIWTIQVVHYPSFIHLGKDGFQAGYRSHLRGILPLTGFLMSLEITVFLIWWVQMSWSAQLTIPALCLAWIWGSTFLIHIPQHKRLSTGYDPVLIQQLVLTNWGRTIAWSVRTIWLWAWLAD